MKFPRHLVLLTPLTLAAGLILSLTAAVAADTRWTPVGSHDPGSSGDPLWSISASPAQPSLLLAASQQRGILRSSDGGTSWSSVIGAVDKAWVVRFNPKQPTTVYAGTQAQGFYKSTDEGKTWTAQNEGLTNLDVRALEVNGGLIVAGTAQGVFYSNDDAASWHGLGLTSLSISAVGLLPRADGMTIFAGADNGAAGTGYLSRTDDLSGTWTAVKGTFPGDAVVAALAVAPAPSGGSQPPVLAGTSQGLFRSDDRGATWTAVGGLPTADVNQVLFNPANPDQIYVGSDADQGNGGVVRSLDRGASWSPLGAGLPSKPRVTALALQPANPVQVVAATWNPTDGSAGAYRITDTAATVVGASPAATAVTTASAAATSRSTTSVPTVPVRRSSGSFNYQPYAAAGTVVLALVIVVLMRRWFRRREDRRTYGA